MCTGALALSPDDAAVYLPWLQAQRAAGRTVVIDANMRPSVLRDLDARGVQQIWVELPPDTPDWEGVRDRLQRAAA